MAKISIHRALSELKLIDNKIASKIEALVPSGVRQAEKPINGYYDEKQFTENAQSHFDSVQALMKRKLLIKSAIVKSNGETMVKIGSQEMTVADAINYKGMIKIKRQFIVALKGKHKRSTDEFTRLQSIVNTNLQTILEASFGKDNVKAGKEDVENISKPFLALNSYILFDPLKVDEKVKELEKEVDEFESEVDAVLSETNATTQIEIAD